MIVVIDANVLVANPALDSRAWQVLRGAIEKGTASVVIPDFAFLEAVAALRRKRTESLAAIRAQEHWGKRGKVLVEGAVFSLESQTERTEVELREVVRSAGIKIRKGPAVSHEIVVRRASARVRPFDAKGSGYRDTLHWFFVLEQYERNGSRHAIAFISNDVTAFGAPQRDGNELHPDLLRDVRRVDFARSSQPADQGLFWRKAVAHLEVPDVFEEDAHPAADFISPAQLRERLAESLATSMPVSVSPRVSPFGGLVQSAVISRVDSVVVVDSVARRYLHRARFAALDFVADCEVTFSGFGAHGSDSFSLRNLSATGNARATGRVDLDIESRLLGDLDVTWTSQKLEIDVRPDDQEG